MSDLKGELQTIEGAIETKTRDKNEFLKTTEGEIKSKTKEIEEKTKQKNTVKGDIANLEKIVKEIKSAPPTSGSDASGSWPGRSPVYLSSTSR